MNDEVKPLDMQENEEFKPQYIDPCAPLEDFSQRKWITKEEALKMWPKCEIAAVITYDDLINSPAPDFKWPKRTESTLNCTNETCRCKLQKKENEGLKRESNKN